MSRFLSNIRFVLSIFLYLLGVIISHASTQLEPNSSTFRSITEQIFIHTDREIYIAGEKLFFKAYLRTENNQLGNDNSKIIYILIRNSSQKNMLTTRIWLDNGTGFGHLYLPDTLSTGFYQLVSYTNWMLESNENCFFSKEIFIANRFDKDLQSVSWTDDKNFNLSINISDSLLLNPIEKKGERLTLITNQKIYPTRSRINIESQFSTTDPNDSIANVSFSVSELNPFNTNPQNDITNNFISGIPNAINQSIHTHFNRIETKGLIISGNVFSKDSKGIDSVDVFLSTPDSVVNIQNAVTDSLGAFNFMLNDYYEGKDLFFKSVSQSKIEVALIKIKDKYKIRNPYTPSLSKFSSGFKNFITKSQDIVTIRKTYGDDSTIVVPYESGFYFCPQLYSKPDFKAYTKDFFPLNNLVEITQEMLYGVKLRKVKSQYNVYILDSRLKKFLSNEPFVFLDGVLIENVNPIISFGSEKIKFIDVINATWVLDRFSFPGILAVFTHDKDDNQLKDMKNQLVVSAGEFQPRSIYIGPSYSSEKNRSRIPDFRQLLYWNPQINLKRNDLTSFEFYSSDLCTDYLIKIQGITSKGKPLSAELIVRVQQ